MIWQREPFGTTDFSQGPHAEDINWNPGKHSKKLYINIKSDKDEGLQFLKSIT